MHAPNPDGRLSLDSQVQNPSKVCQTRHQSNSMSGANIPEPRWLTARKSQNAALVSGIISLGCTARICFKRKLSPGRSEWETCLQPSLRHSSRNTPSTQKRVGHKWVFELIYVYPISSWDGCLMRASDRRIGRRQQHLRGSPATW